MNDTNLWYNTTIRKGGIMFKDVIGYEDEYGISKTGIIRSKDRICVDSLGRKRFRKGIELKPDIAQNGYYRMTLCKGGKKKQQYLHRLIAIHFIPNPYDKPQINHKDGNKLNNSIDNLEWVTAQENTIHAYKNDLIDVLSGERHPNYGKVGAKSKRAKKVLRTNVKTGEEKVYGALVETEKDGFLKSEVSRSCNRGGIHKGHTFEFIT